MNVRIYASLFSRRDKLFFAGSFVFFVLIAFLLSQSGRGRTDNLHTYYLILAPPFGLGMFLAEVWYRPFQRPATALLPAIQDTLFRWHTRFILMMALAWAVMFHWIELDIPLVTLGGISAGMFTLPMLFMPGRPRHPHRFKRFIFLFGVIVGIIFYLNVRPLFMRGLGNQILTHATIAGIAGWTLAAGNLWFAKKRGRPQTLAEQVSGDLSSMFKPAWAGSKRPTSSPVWNYGTRGNSLFHLVRAAFQEMPWGTLVLPCLCLLVVVSHPLLAHRDHAASFLLGWYQPVFAPNTSAETVGSTVILIMTMFGMSMGFGLMRSGQFYPISRRQRTATAFATSLVVFGIIFFGIAGGSALAGWFVGLWAGLPFPPQSFVEFTLRMAMVIPFMPLIRWGALRLELSSNAATLILFIGFVATLMTISQSLFLDWGPKVGAVICGASIIASLFAYHAALRRFYQQGDLVQRGPVKAGI